MAQRTNMRRLNGNLKLDQDSLKKVFLIQLNNMYSAKSYLIVNLPVMADAASFVGLRDAIMEVVDGIKLHMLRLDIIFDLINEKYRPRKNAGIRAFTIEAYAMSKFPDMLDLEVDLMLLHHLRTIESIEMSNYAILYELAIYMPNRVLSVLLKQNINLVKETKSLYELITKEYIR